MNISTWVVPPQPTIQIDFMKNACNGVFYAGVTLFNAQLK